MQSLFTKYKAIVTEKPLFVKQKRLKRIYEAKAIVRAPPGTYAVSGQTKRF